MTFHATLDGFVFGLDIMGYQDRIGHFRMAFDAPDALKVPFLVRQPLVPVEHIEEVPVGQELETVLV